MEGGKGSQGETAPYAEGERGKGVNEIVMFSVSIRLSVQPAVLLGAIAAAKPDSPPAAYARRACEPDARHRMTKRHAHTNPVKF